MEGYTKGEWEVYNGHSGQFYHKPYITTKPDPMRRPPITTVARILSAPTDSESRANAHLIAAAPDCHKELSGIINAYERLGWSAFIAYMSKHKEDSIKALAKAEGN